MRGQIILRFAQISSRLQRINLSRGTYSNDKACFWPGVTHILIILAEENARRPQFVPLGSLTRGMPDVRLET